MEDRRGNKTARITATSMAGNYQLNPAHDSSNRKTSNLNSLRGSQMQVPPTSQSRQVYNHDRTHQNMNSNKEKENRQRGQSFVVRGEASERQ
jgi:hypothetical protein